MRILFAATGTIALPLLDALAAKGYAGAVLTMPDAPGKRGKALIPPPVKVRAEELGLPVYQPETIRSEAREAIKAFSCDALLSFSYGKIFGPKFLSLFETRFNVHPSLLPKYRGCAPIYAAIRNMDRDTGISLQRIELGIDEGDIYSVLPISLDGTETCSSLEDKVGAMAPSLVLPVLEDTPSPFPQSGESSYTSFIGKEDGRIDFSQPACSIHAQIRACNPWPKAYCTLDSSPLIFTGVSGSAFDEAEPCSEEPGTICSLEKGRGLKIATGLGYIYVNRVLPPMRNEMDAQSFINGNREVLGRVLR